MFIWLASYPKSRADKMTGEKIPFFNLGKKMISPKIKDKIENAFKEEMKEVGYI